MNFPAFPAPTQAMVDFAQHGASQVAAVEWRLVARAELADGRRVMPSQKLAKMVLEAIANGLPSLAIAVGDEDTFDEVPDAAPVRVRPGGLPTRRAKARIKENFRSHGAGFLVESEDREEVLIEALPENERGQHWLGWLDALDVEIEHVEEMWAEGGA